MAKHLRRIPGPNEVPGFINVTLCTAQGGVGDDMHVNVSDIVSVRPFGTRTMVKLRDGKELELADTYELVIRRMRYATEITG